MNAASLLWVNGPAVMWMIVVTMDAGVHLEQLESDHVRCTRSSQELRGTFVDVVGIAWIDQLIVRR